MYRYFNTSKNNINKNNLELIVPQKKKKNYSDSQIRRSDKCNNLLLINQWHQIYIEYKINKSQ